MAVLLTVRNLELVASEDTVTKQEKLEDTLDLPWLFLEVLQLMFPITFYWQERVTWSQLTGKEKGKCRVPHVSLVSTNSFCHMNIFICHLLERKKIDKREEMPRRYIHD